MIIISSNLLLSYLCSQNIIINKFSVSQSSVYLKDIHKLVDITVKQDHHNS